MIFQEFLNTNYENVFTTFFNNLKLWKLDMSIWNDNLQNSFKNLIFTILKKYQNANLLYLDVEYCKSILLSILNQHGTILSIIFERNKDKLNLEYVTNGSNKVGYSGFDLDNQAGQFQTTTNTNSNIQANTARNWSIYLIFKEQYGNIIYEFENSVVTNLLQIIY